jgi:hypothetical protein
MRNMALRIGAKRKTSHFRSGLAHHCAHNSRCCNMPTCRIPLNQGCKVRFTSLVRKHQLLSTTGRGPTNKKYLTTINNATSMSAMLIWLATKRSRAVNARSANIANWELFAPWRGHELIVLPGLKLSWFKTVFATATPIAVFMSMASTAHGKRDATNSS